MKGHAAEGRLSAEELQEIKARLDWQRVFVALGLQRDERKSKPQDWWALSPFQAEKTPSFHIDQTGGYYCFATGQGGDLLDLVQRLQQLPHAYAAARWLLEHGCVPGMVSPAVAVTKTVIRGRAQHVRSAQTKGAAERTNPPIRPSLLPKLSQQGTHPQFADRGISAATCQDLGCGYLEPGAVRSGNSMAGKIVFQIRGVRGVDDLTPVVLSHIGRATTPEQAERDGKWTLYKGFAKTLELYGLDRLVNAPAAIEQAQATGHILLVEGCFDLAKCVEAGVENVVASFGATLSEVQVRERLELIAQVTGVRRCLVWYDRDEAGAKGQQAALQQLLRHDWQAEGFRWDRTFASPVRGSVGLPPGLDDVCALSVKQLRWLRGRGVV